MPFFTRNLGMTWKEKAGWMGMTFLHGVFSMRKLWEMQPRTKAE